MTIAHDYKTRTSYTEDAAQQKAAHKILLVHQFEPSLPGPRLHQPHAPHRPDDAEGHGEAGHRSR